MAYSSASDAALFCPELIGGNTGWDDQTTPTRDQIDRFVARGYSRINTVLAQAGYNVPVVSSATVYDTLTDLEAMYAGARAQMARMSSRLGPEERGKGQVLMEQFDKELAALCKRDLTRAGATRRSAGGIYVGGISESDKLSYERDTDRVQPRFTREQFRRSGTERPAGAMVDEESN